MQYKARERELKMQQGKTRKISEFKKEDKLSYSQSLINYIPSLPCIYAQPKVEEGKDETKSTNSTLLQHLQLIVNCTNMLSN
jgi:hypothetical protein